MKISTKGRYALRMLVDISIHQSDGFIALKTIAERQDISKKYLEQIVPILNHGGILITNRGYQGGYRLSKAPEDITVGEILKLTEGSIAPVSCIQNGAEPVNCNRSADCPTLPVWLGLSKVINDYLNSITLRDLIDQSVAYGIDDYVI